MSTTKPPRVFINSNAKSLRPGHAVWMRSPGARVESRWIFLRHLKDGSALLAGTGYYKDRSVSLSPNSRVRVIASTDPLFAAVVAAVTGNIQPA